MSDPRLASSHLHADVRRLEAQVQLSWSREAAALRRLGFTDGQAVLEVGCGPGFITERLLAEFAHSSVTAIELDPAMASLARARLQRDLGTRLEVVDASVSLTPFADAAFDGALARYVFQHLAAPDLAAAELYRVLKPGGHVAIIDTDDDLGGLLVPAVPSMQRVLLKLGQIQRQRGGDRTIGRKLWRLLAAAGFVALDLQALLFHSDELGLGAFSAQYEPRRLRRFVHPGGITEEEWAAYRGGWAEFLATPDALIVQLILLASGVKPLAATPPEPALAPGAVL